MIAVAAATILLAMSIKPSPARVLALGDSYTIGESVAVADRWPNQLAQALRAKGMSIGEPEIVARTGWTTDRLSSGIDVAKPLGPYSLVTLMIGVNDQYWDRDRDRYRAGFVALLERAIGYAGGNAKRVVVVSIPDWGVTPFAIDRDRAKIAAQIDRFNAVAREESIFAGAHFVDVTPISRRAATDPTLLAPDGLHPSAKMYAQWVTVIEPVARLALATNRGRCTNVSFDAPTSLRRSGSAIRRTRTTRALTSPCPGTPIVFR